MASLAKRPRPSPEQYQPTDEIQLYVKKVWQNVEEIGQKLSVMRYDGRGGKSKGITEVKELFEKHKQCVEKLKEKAEHLDHENGTSNREDEVQQIKQELKEVRKENEELKSKVKELEKKVDLLTTELNSTKEALALGQVAFVFEQKVARYVLPKAIRIGKVGAYQTMLRWLEKGENRQTKEWKMANERWESLKGEVKWNVNHIEALKTLKELRVGIAHPDVDLEEAKAQIPKYISQGQEQECLDIIALIKKLDEKQSTIA